MKRTIITILGMAMVVLFMPLCVLRIDSYASTEQTQGEYTYTVSDGNATIISVDKSISGNITTPAKLGGYPVTRIEEKAFKGCSGITGVVISEGIKSIGYFAFEGCGNIESVTIPKTVTIISAAFPDKSKIRIVNFNAINFGGSSTEFYDCESLTTVIIGDDVKKIPGYFFGSCNNLTKVSIGKSVEEIGPSAFIACTQLKDINFPEGIVSIGSSAFSNCPLIERVVVPNIVSIGGSAFENCKNLKEVKFGENLKNIGASAFENCSSLVDIVIPDKVQEIGIYAFANCTSLTNVSVGNLVYKIHEYAFYNCAIKEIKLPGSLTTLKKKAFGECKNLTTVRIGRYATIYNEAFTGCENLKKIKYDGTKESWERMVGDQKLRERVSKGEIEILFSIPNQSSSLSAASSENSKPTSSREPVITSSRSDDTSSKASTTNQSLSSLSSSLSTSTSTSTYISSVAENNEYDLVSSEVGVRKKEKNSWVPITVFAVLIFVSALVIVLFKIQKTK